MELKEAIRLFEANLIKNKPVPGVAYYFTEGIKDSLKLIEAQEILLSLAQRYLELEAQGGVKKKSGIKGDCEYFKECSAVLYNQALEDCLLWWAGRCDVEKLREFFVGLYEKDSPPVDGKCYQFLGNYILKYGKEEAPTVGFVEKEADKLAQIIHDYLVGKEANDEEG